MEGEISYTDDGDRRVYTYDSDTNGSDTNDSNTNDSDTKPSLMKTIVDDTNSPSVFTDITLALKLNQYHLSI